jgi:prepilin-type N-terminal cleavage/methylation domain-containing protein
MMKRRQIVKGRRGKNRGFTLIEIIAVLVILAIISAVAVSRVGSNESNLRAELNDLKAALRYAQQMAIASDSTITFRIAVNSSGYTISRPVGGTGSQPLLPGESSSSHTFSSVSGPGSAVTFNFNEWGGIGSNRSVTLTPSGGGPSKTINVIGETGYAYEP